MKTDELDFELPPELIAQVPADRRDEARLLHYSRSSRSMDHRSFKDLASILRQGDLLVLNDSRVLPAKFTLTKPTGGRIEGLFLEELEPGRWRVLLKGAGNAPVGSRLSVHGIEHLEATIDQRASDGEHTISLSTSESAEMVLWRIGRIPLPPYIRRDKDHDERDVLDRERYQTVYAKFAGSVAAPTAGLHFSNSTLSLLEARGIERTAITLHVSLGTFKPLAADDLSDHVMHVERYEVSPEAAAALNRAKRENRRIVAVGTTSCRVIESQPCGAEFSAHRGQTSIFIHPPYQWKHVGGLITNFHLPRSTLIALVAAFVGIDEQRRIYRAAIEQKYRFFSYGDCSLLE
jgi:S-adenosylmethionine:tRNA ribosyltransferase-isomerase